MQKIRLIGYLLLLFLGSCFIYSITAFFAAYIPYYVKTHLRNIKGHKIKGNHILEYLNQLTAMPAIGDIFYEDKITELAMLEKWQNVINQSLLALNTSVNKNSFSIWYHKAMAECISLKLKQCENSLHAAQYLAENYESLYVMDLKKFLKQRKQGYLLKQESMIKKSQMQSAHFNHSKIIIQEDDGEIIIDQEQQSEILLHNI